MYGRASKYYTKKKFGHLKNEYSLEKLKENKVATLLLACLANTVTFWINSLVKIENVSENSKIIYTPYFSHFSLLICVITLFRKARSPNFSSYYGELYLL